MSCVQLAAKLDALYNSFRAHPELVPRVRADAELAKHLSISKATLSAWRSGNATKNRDAGRLKPEQLEELVALATFARGDVDSLDTARSRIQQEDRDRLLVDTKEVFETWLRGVARTPLSSILAAKAPTLDMYMARHRGGLAISPEQHRPEPGEFLIARGEPFTLNVFAATRRRLVVLNTGKDGRSWLVPGPTHDGTVTRRPERLPAHDHWRFDEGDGPHSFVAIEVPAAAPIHPRSRTEPTALTQERETHLIAVLTDPAFADRWAWGKCAYFILPVRWTRGPGDRAD